MRLLSVASLLHILAAVCFVLGAAEPTLVARPMSEELLLPVVELARDAAEGLCTLQKTFQSSSARSLPLPKDLKQPPESKGGSAPPSRTSLSLLQFRATSVAGWTSIAIILCCCCLCGSAAGEWLLRKVTRYSLTVTQLQERVTSLEKEREGAEAGSGEMTSSSNANAAGARLEGQQSDGSESATGDEGDEGSAKLYEEYLASYWKYYAESETPNIFKHDNLRIVADGGLKDVPKLKVKYGKAAFVLGATLMNCILIVATDVKVLSGRPAPGEPNMAYGNQDFLLSKWLLSILLNAEEQSSVLYMVGSDMNKIVPLLELMFLAFTMVLATVSVAGAILANFIFGTKRADLQKWTLASTFFWHCVPQLTSLSALRLLHFVQPTIFYSDAYVVCLQSYEVVFSEGRKQFRHYAHSVFAVVFFVLSRFLALVLGFDAFLVKFRMASSSLDSGSSNMPSELAAIAFVWQVMGIIHLKWFVEKRLFIFLFAGKHGYMDIDEEALTDVWKALVLKKVYATFGFWRATIVMLGFDTYDMQFLALDDDEDADATYVDRVAKRDTLARRQSGWPLS